MINRELVLTHSETYPAVGSSRALQLVTRLKRCKRGQIAQPQRGLDATGYYWHKTTSLPPSLIAPDPSFSISDSRLPCKQ